MMQFWTASKEGLSVKFIQRIIYENWNISLNSSEISIIYKINPFAQSCVLGATKTLSKVGCGKIRKYLKKREKEYFPVYMCMKVGLKKASQLVSKGPLDEIRVTSF